jgi:hypothetical protein
MYNDGDGDVLLCRAPTAGDGAAVPGMGAKWRGWPHKAGVGGGDTLR